MRYRFERVLQFGKRSDIDYTFYNKEKRIGMEVCMYVGRCEECEQWESKDIQRLKWVRWQHIDTEWMSVIIKIVCLALLGGFRLYATICALIYALEKHIEV